VPTTYKILPDLDLVYMRVTGAIVIEETLAILRQYLEHPDYKPNRDHLHDLSEMSIVKIDFQAVLAVQDQVVSQQTQSASSNLVVYYAPTELGQSVAKDLRSLWAPFPSVEIMIATTLDEAADMLGRNVDSLRTLVRS
jgi:hypothetical protein